MTTVAEIGEPSAGRVRAPPPAVPSRRWFSLQDSQRGSATDRGSQHQVFAHANPLTYLVDTLRTLMVEGSRSVYGLGVDLAVLLAALLLLVLAAGHLYPTVVR